MSGARLTFFGAVAALVFTTSDASGQASRRSAFVLNNVSDEISSFVIGCDGSAALIGTYPSSDGPQTAALSPSGRWLAVGHGTMSNTVEALWIYEVKPDSSLTTVLQTTTPDSPLDLAWLSETQLVVTDTSVGGSNFLLRSTWDPSVPALTLAQTLFSGTFTTSLALTPSGALLYSQDSLQNDISWHTVAADGTLAAGSTIDTGSLFPLEQIVSPDGLNLYSVNGISGGGHNVLAYIIGAGGALTAVADSPFQSPGQSPANIAINESGTLVFVGHGTDATVRSFLRDAEDGALTSTGFSFDIGLQGSIGDVQVLGDYLLVTDETTAIDGITGLYVFAIEPDGSFAQVGRVHPSDGVRPETIVVWGGVAGDYTVDGLIDVNDLVMALIEWNQDASSPADGNCDGVVDELDLQLVIDNWSDAEGVTAAALKEALRRAREAADRGDG